jgi:tyrosinase
MPNRRTVLLSSATTMLSGLLAPVASQPITTRTRYNARSQQGKAMLRIYAEAVKAMKGRSAQDARSWNFQWYIHASPEDKDEAVRRVYGNASSPARDLANDTWWTCQSHDGQPQDYFLPWHRLYVMHFEEIIRTISGRDDFTLPYWDYTSPDSYSIPDEFQEKNSNDPVLGALFMQNRNKDEGPLRSADVNAGEPLNKHFTGVRNFLVLPDMAESEYTAFCSQLDARLHGAVHVYTGDSTNMGTVPTAAEDPVFWLHHCNIDRIWAGWNKAGGMNPTDTNGKTWADTKFVFVGRAGNRVEVAIGTIADSATLPYRYDELPAALGAQILVAGPPQEEKLLLRSAAPGAGPASAGLATGTAAPVPLGAVPQTVELVPTAPQSSLPQAALNLNLGSQTRLVLSLKEVQAQADPNTTYEVFLDLPPNAPPDVANQHHVGLLNFFGIARSGSHGAHGGRTLNFDVTRVVESLRSRGSLQDKTTVTLVPVGPPANGSAPVISGGIELQRR